MSSDANIFHLTKLPYLCLQNVLGNTHLLDLSNLSLVSKKFHEHVKCLKIKNLDGFTVAVRKNRLDVTFIENGARTIGAWHFYRGEKAAHATIGLKYMFYKKNKSFFIRKIIESQNPKLYPFLSDNPVISAKNCLNYFSSLFNRQSSILMIFPDGVDDPFNDVKLFGIEKCSNVSMYGKELLKKEEELNGFLSEMNVTQCAILSVPTTPSFVFNAETCSPNGIILNERDGQWMTRDVLFGLKSHEICAFNCNEAKVTAVDFIDFVTRWFNSEDVKFRHLAMKWVTPFDRARMFPLATVNLGVQRFEEGRRSPFIPHMSNKKIDTTRHGYDFQRRDGLWATVVLTRREFLLFHVWHTKFPDLSGRQLVYVI